MSVNEVKKDDSDKGIDLFLIVVFDPASRKRKGFALLDHNLPRRGNLWRY